MESNNEMLLSEHAISVLTELSMRATVTGEYLIAKSIRESGETLYKFTSIKSIEQNNTRVRACWLGLTDLGNLSLHSGFESDIPQEFRDRDLPAHSYKVIENFFPMRMEECSVANFNTTNLSIIENISTFIYGWLNAKSKY